MGNYNPLYRKQRSSKEIKLNIENISEEPVFSVVCSKCESILSERGCQIHLASDLKISGYSTDSPPEALEEGKSLEKCKECSCLITKAHCKKCKNFCAIHSIYLCQFCKKQPTNGHNWIFIDSIVGKKTETKWGQLEPLPIVRKNFEQLLVLVGVSQEGIAILKKEKILSLQQLRQLSNELLKQAGLCLGDIGKLRQFE